MTITFKNDNDVIVYALREITFFAMNHQYIFAAQTVWWLASIIGLQWGLVTHIDKLRTQTAVKIREVSATLQDIPEESRSNIALDHIHPDMITYIQTKRSSDSESQGLDSVLKKAEKGFQDSERVRATLNRKQGKGPLHKSWPGKLAFQPST
jgi:hypothetical protein